MRRIWFIAFVLALSLTVPIAYQYSWAKAEVTGSTVVGEKNLALPDRVIKPSDIRFSAEYGRIVETFDGGGTILVIHMQDTHTNYEAQKNAANILEELIKNYGLYLILVEGGSRDVSLNNYRDGTSLDERKKMAENWLKEGTIAGEEYLNIASDYPMKLQGIEDRTLYDQNMEAFLEVDKGKNDAMSYTGQLSSVVANLKVKVYSKQLKELDEKKAGFNEEKVSLNDYVRYLGDIAQAKKADLAAYANYKNLFDSLELEKTIDFNTVERERTGAIEVISKKCNVNELNELLAKSAEFKAGRMTQAQYHIYLRDMMAKARVDINKYQNLKKYVTYLTAYEKIDSGRLFSELKAIEDMLEGLFYANEDQRRLAKIASDLQLLIDFIDLKLTPADFDYYCQNEAGFNVVVWARFLNSQSDRYKLTQKIPEDAQAIDKIIKPLKDFYRVARQRDEVFLNNTKKYIAREGVNHAVLIAGGFHTPSLTQLFRQNNISYVVVIPKVVKATDEKLYHKILTEGWAPAEAPGTQEKTE